MTASDGSVASEVGVVETDVPCPRGHNLRGLPRGGRYPECALTVEEGLRRFEQPFDAEQFRRVVSGIGFMLIAYAGWLTTGLALAPLDHLCVFAGTGFGASLCLAPMRHATRRLLEPSPPTAAGGTACGSP